MSQLTDCIDLWPRQFNSYVMFLGGWGAGGQTRHQTESNYGALTSPCLLSAGSLASILRQILYIHAPLQKVACIKEECLCCLAALPQFGEETGEQFISAQSK